MSQKPVLVTTTVPSKEKGLEIAKKLVSEKIAACVNMMPVYSVYEWENSIHEDSEYKLFIKTFENKWSTVKETIQKNHPYKVPEISMIYIENMHDEYFNWMKDVCNT